jgi:hypothetical protein
MSPFDVQVSEIDRQARAVLTELGTDGDLE